MATVRVVIDPNNVDHVHRLATKLYAAGMGIDAFAGNEVDQHYSDTLRRMVREALIDFTATEVE